VSGINPAITQKIESMGVSYAVQQFLKDLLLVEANLESGKNQTYGAVIDEYVQNQDIENWVQEPDV